MSKSVMHTVVATLAVLWVVYHVSTVREVLGGEAA